MQINTQCVLPEVFGILSNENFWNTMRRLTQIKLKSLGKIPAYTKEFSVSLTLLSTKKMQEINYRYRGVDAPTDVLSFPMWEDKNGNYVPPEDWEELPLGDIVICPDVVIKNASDNGKQPYEELALVFFHSVLHLIGYDHDTEKRKDEMWTLQDELTTSLKEEFCNGK